jgi:hypothetical protein
VDDLVVHRSFPPIRIVVVRYWPCSSENPETTNIAKLMTLPTQSGTMSQLYRGFSWISMVANLAGATTVASILTQFDPFASHFASL